MKRMFEIETNDKENAGFLKIVYFWLMVEHQKSESRIWKSDKTKINIS